jgi:hypothetical protein
LDVVVKGRRIEVDFVPDLGGTGDPFVEDREGVLAYWVPNGLDQPRVEESLKTTPRRSPL